MRLPMTTHRTLQRLIASTVLLAAACSENPTVTKPRESESPGTGVLALTSPSAALSVAQGATTTITVNIARTNVSDPVSFTLSGAPSGVTTSFQQSPTTAASTTLSLQVASTVPVGSYPLTIRASATGAATASLAVTLTVSTSGSGVGNVTLFFCGPAADLPIWLATQNAAGTWQRVLPSATNSYRITRAGNEGLAYVVGNPAGFSLTVRYDAIAELTGGCVDQTQFRSVSGTVRGLGATDGALVQLGPTAIAFPTAAAPAFTLTTVPPGPIDLIATRSPFDVASGRTIPDRVIIRRGLNPANGSALAAIDFADASESFAPEPLTVNVSGGGSDSIETFITFRTLNGSGANLAGSSTARPAPLRRIPAARTANGDLHSIQAFADAPNGAFRSVVTEFRNPSPVISLALGPALNVPTIEVAATAPYARYRARLIRQAEYRDFLGVVIAQSDRSVFLFLSDKGPGADASLDWTLPDFSAVAGWDNTWAPRPSAPILSTSTVGSGFVRGEGTVGRVAGRTTVNIR